MVYAETELVFMNHGATWPGNIEVERYPVRLMVCCMEQFRQRVTRHARRLAARKHTNLDFIGYQVPSGLENWCGKCKIR